MYIEHNTTFGNQNQNVRNTAKIKFGSNNAVNMVELSGIDDLNKKKSTLGYFLSGEMFLIGKTYSRHIYFNVMFFRQRLVVGRREDGAEAVRLSVNIWIPVRGGKRTLRVINGRR